MGLFNLFKIKKKTIQNPDFEFLKNYNNKDKYFIRTMQWDWLDDKMIHVFDNKSTRLITMDEWPQHVFLKAKGQITIKEYIMEMAGLYPPGEVPPTLDKDIIATIEGLIEDGELLRLESSKMELPYYLDQPKFQQDIDKAYQMMIDDGYIARKE
ncbi:MAG: hypothetical protein ACSHWW_06845 [Nonlabens sp.]|uniref:hypothetical protein n=1 Tax=Nonlabens sp. TaxID=1888209 RepID=UPI003EF5F9A6